MKKVLILMLGLVASSASFAGQTTDNNPDVFIQSINQKVQVYIAPQTAQATVRLRDEGGHTLFTKTSSATTGLREKLDLSQLEPGVYQLTIDQNGQTVQKTIVIEFVPAQKQVSLKA